MRLVAEFAQVLQHHRAQCNLRVKEACHLNSQLDPADFFDFLQHQVNPIIAALAKEYPEKVNAAVLEAFDIGLELVAKKIAGPGARHPSVNIAWEKCAAAYTHLIAIDATAFLGSLTNGVLNVESLLGNRAVDWLDKMSALSSKVNSVKQFQQLGYVCAWRFGFAHTRSKALAIANHLPERLALAALDAPGDANWESIYNKLLHDHWWRPDQPLSDPPLRVGNYVGFGGLFTGTPVVNAAEEGFYIADGENYFFLQADCYGSVFLPATQEEFASGFSADTENPFPLLDKRAHRFEHEKFGYPSLSMDWVHNRNTIVLFTDYSYILTILPNHPHDR